MNGFLLAMMVGASELTFSTYFGGSQADYLRDVVVDASGNVYVTGGTESADFTTTAGAHDRSFNGNHDVFVAKLTPGGALVWSTFLGGPNYDRAYAIELLGDGSIVVAGRAGAGFPTTPGVVQTAFAGDLNPNGLYGPQDGFVAKLTADGTSVVWSTYFGTDDRGFIRDIDVDAAGNVYLAEPDVSRPFPHVTGGAYQTALGGGADMVIAKLSPDATSVVFATYFGGSGDDGFAPSICIDGAGRPVVLGTTTSADMPTTPGAYDRTFNGGGYDLSVTKLDAAGAALVWSTFLGGSSGDGTETHELALGVSDEVLVVTGSTSSDYPTTPGAFQETYQGSGGSGTGLNTNYPGDVVASKLSADGASLLASTFVGGRWGEAAEGVSMDGGGNVYFSGATYSDDYPTTADAHQATVAGQADMIATVLASDLSHLVYSSVLGGTAEDYGRCAAIGPNHAFLIGGHTLSSDFPTRNPAQGTRRGNWDGSLAKLTIDPEALAVDSFAPRWMAGAPRPNPSFGVVSWPIRLVRASPARVQLFSANGARVRSLPLQSLPAGESTIAWDGRNVEGVRVPAGTYFYEVTAGTWKSTGRIVISAR